MRINKLFREITIISSIEFEIDFLKLIQHYLFLKRQKITFKNFCLKFNIPVLEVFLHIPYIKSHVLHSEQYSSFSVNSKHTVTVILQKNLSKLIYTGILILVYLPYMKFHIGPYLEFNIRVH